MTENELPLPTGYTARPAVMDDVPAVIDLINATLPSPTEGEGVSVAEKRNAWTTPGLNIATDTQLILAPDGAPIALLEYWDIQEPHIQPSLALYLHPDFPSPAVGQYLMDWTDRRAQTTLDLAPAGQPVHLLCGLDAREERSLALLKANNYQESRHFYQMLLEMSESPSPPVWPEGFHSRDYVAGQDDRPTHETMEAAFADHWRHVPISYRQWLHWNIEHEEFDPSLWVLALEGQHIVGALMAWPTLDGAADTGFISDLGVRPAWRRRGIAQALLRQSFATFYVRGNNKVALTVDTESTTGANRLYEQVGMRPVNKRIVFEKLAGLGRRD